MVTDTKNSKKKSKKPGNILCCFPPLRVWLQGRRCYPQADKLRPGELMYIPRAQSRSQQHHQHQPLTAGRYCGQIWIRIHWKFLKFGVSYPCKVFMILSYEASPNPLHLKDPKLLRKHVTLDSPNYLSLQILGEQLVI